MKGFLLPVLKFELSEMCAIIGFRIISTERPNAVKKEISNKEDPKDS